MTQFDMKIGVIGLGQRGSSMIQDVLLPMEGIEVAAVCDSYPDRAQSAAEQVHKATGTAPALYEDYRALLRHPGLDAVYIATLWQNHSEIAIAAMEAGIWAACEVGGAFTENECWKLVETQRRTGTPLMPMENCCFGQTEMMLFELQRAGVFGDIVHCAGSYAHDLREEVSKGNENRHYRLANYLHRCCENYPTHELGPLAKLLSIGSGNRFVSLTSTASRAAGLGQYIADHAPDSPLAAAHFAQGDVVTTVLRCAGGQTITLTFDTTLPRYYSRGLQIHGTKALYCEDNNSLFIDGEHNKHDFDWKAQWNNFEQYRPQYEHPVWKKFLQEGVKGGHNGMDWLTFSAFLDAWQKKAPTPLDVYDMVDWMMVSLLSERSILCGGAPQCFPDFTNGAWLTAERPQL